MSMMSPHLRRLVICGLVLTVWGCATPTGLVQVYEGPQRPQNEVVTLTVPAALEVLAVDGEEIKIPYFGGSDYKLQLLPGQHTLELFYKESWGGPTDSGVVVSDVSMFRFTARAGAEYIAQHDGPKNLVLASRFSDMPRIWLVEPATGQRLEPYATEKYIPVVLRAMRKYAASGQTAAAGAPQASSAASAEDVVMQQDALKRLQFWWKIAGKKDKKAFSDWLAQGAPTEAGGKDAAAMSAQQASSTASAEDVVMQQDALERLQFWWKIAGEKDRSAFKAWLDKGAPTE